MPWLKRSKPEIRRPEGRALLEELCRVNEWEEYDRYEHGIELHFLGDAITPRRTVRVEHSAGEKIALFRCDCRLAVRRDRRPDELMASLLMRNGTVSPGSWVADCIGGTITISHQYVCLAIGLEASFASICALLLKECGRFEAELDELGILPPLAAVAETAVAAEGL